MAQAIAMHPSLSYAVKRAALWYPDKPALIDAEGTVTWAAYRDRVARLAGAFAGLGVRPGDRIAMLSLNSHRYCETFFGSIWAGALMVPLNHRLAQPELLAQLVDCTPRVLLVDREFLAIGRRLFGEAPSLEHLILAEPGDAPEGLTAFESLLAGAQPLEDRAGHSDDIATIFYTGGTTGRAKGVMLSHGNIWSNALNIFAANHYDETTVHLHHGPLFHVSAAARVFNAAIACATQVIVPKFETDVVLTAIERHRVQVTTFVPAMLRALLNLPDFDRYDVSSLKYINYGAAPTEEALLRAAIARFPHVMFLQGYGMTELAPTATMLHGRDHVLAGPRTRLLRSIGRALPSVEVCVVDNDDREVPVGAIGEIVVRGPIVMQGYWNMPEQTAQALRGGWMHTGDLGYQDDEGYFFLVDRKNDMIISGGENVHSVEVENAIASHPAVLECAVIGVPDEQWGEAVHAIAVLHDGKVLSYDDLKAHCRPLIAGYKIPRSLEIRTERLPLSGANKILKAQLRAEKRKPS
jgi:long-chain acyl-CoA synthetase